VTERHYFTPMQLLLNPDYSCVDPLSDINGTMIDAGGLPISETTRKALRAWAKRWDELATRDLHAEWIAEGAMSGSSKPVPAEVWGEHEREGRALWVALQQELGPDWRVGWPTGAGIRNIQWTPDGPAEQLP
jgi:hypothetical protein